MLVPSGVKTGASLILAALLFPLAAAGADWPMGRCDANRSAASPQELPARLHLQWVRDYPPLKPAWPDQPKLDLDAAYSPVVLGKRLFVGSSRHDCVTALDTETGAETWRFYADGPVRYAPVAWEDKVYFVSDDGYLYCLDAAKGALLWKFRGGPNDRKILGNERLISTWPSRGAPVLADGTVYFAAGIWPFMGIFLHALDARTGKVIWTNDGDGSIYIKQPHNADAFAGVAPQGPLVVTGDKLLVPGGRSVPACYDRKTGKLVYYQLGENGKRGGDCEVAAIGNIFCNGGAAFDLGTEKYLGPTGDPVVLTDEVLYCYRDKKCLALKLKTSEVEIVETVDSKGNKVKSAKWTVAELGSLAMPQPTALIKAGTRLYAGAAGRVSAIDLKAGKPSAISWKGDLEGMPVNLLTADDRLFVVTHEGRIYCFGAKRVEPKVHKLPPPSDAVRDAWTDQAHTILEMTKSRDGYCIVWGIGSGRLVTELARQSNLRIVAIEPDARKVQTLREKLHADGISCERVAILPGNWESVVLPPYLASLMVVETLPATPREETVFLQKAFASLRPYGGVACLSLAAEKRKDFQKLADDAGLVNAKVREAGELVLLSREGALPGSANWTHEHADAANTRVSKDKLVKAPLGVLWFGGPSHNGVLPRHGHGPQPQVIDGRLLIEGVDMLRCMDIYTGRVLWEARLPGVGAFYNNLSHQPGANSSGTNFISTADGIYVAYGKVCLRLDPATGKKMSEFKLPKLPDAPPATVWGYINVAGDYLVAGVDPLFDPALYKPVLKGGEDKTPENRDKDAKSDEPDGVLGLVAKLLKAGNDNFSSSKHLVVMDRHSGKVLWTVTARDGFRHNAICVGGDRVYAIDRLSGLQLAKLKRRGETPKNKTRLSAFDLKTGKEIWSSEDDVFGTWLSYSAERDVLVEAGRVARDAISDEPKGMRAYRAGTGAILWFEKTHAGPAMIHGDTILMAGSACSLLTGAPKMRSHPLTGEQVPWTWIRNYGCNTPAASENLLTFRSGAAGFLDYCNDGGTGNLGGFRSSCTNNLIVAGGLLNAPDYTRTCVCNYQNQTSLALIHMPEAELWTFFGASPSKERIRRLGINLGAPGDRRAEDGTLWLEYPSVGGVSPAVPVTVTPEKPEWFRRHALQVEGSLNWVAASGAKGLSSLKIELAKDAKAERPYTVRLYFMEPDDMKPGERVFDIALQGETTLKGLDIVKETGGRNRALVKEFKGIKVKNDLVLRLTPSAVAKGSVPVLSGIEVLAEGW